MGEPDGLFECEQHKVGLAVHGLMSAAKDISDLSYDGCTACLLRADIGDIELTRNHLNGVLERLRG